MYLIPVAFLQGFDGIAVKADAYSIIGILDGVCCHHADHLLCGVEVRVVGVRDRHLSFVYHLYAFGSLNACHRQIQSAILFGYRLYLRQTDTYCACVVRIDDAREAEVDVRSVGHHAQIH